MILREPASNSAEKPVVGLVGVGKWGRYILRDLVALGCEVHAVARSESSIANAREYGAASIVGSIEELPELQGAIAAPIATRHTEVIDALAATQPGPIYTEKPLTIDAGEADRLAAELSDRLFVMDKWRYHPGILELARLARSGEIGEFQSISSRRVTTINPHPDVSTIWTHASHDLSIALEIVGEVPRLRHAAGEYVNGVLVGVDALLGEHPWMALEVSDAAPGHRRETRIVCSEGAAMLDGGWSEQVSIRRFDGREDEVVETPGELPLLAELRAFVEHLGGGPAPKSSAAEGASIVRRLQEMIELADASRPNGHAS